MNKEKKNLTSLIIGIILTLIGLSGVVITIPGPSSITIAPAILLILGIILALLGGLGKW